MCQAGNNLPTPLPGFSEAAAPLSMSDVPGSCWVAGEVTARAAAAMLAQHVVPRLVAAHAWAGRARVGDIRHAGSAMDRRVVDRCVAALIGGDAGAPLALVDALRADGVGCEAICHDVLAPAARQLRALWHEDACDYAACRLGLWRLRRLLDAVDHGAVCRRAAHRDPASALFLTLGAEADSFEHALVIRTFERCGWLTRRHSGDDTLPAALQAQPFHIAWLSIGPRVPLFDIAATIRAIRLGSCNRDIGIVCGGADELPAAGEVGADAVATDARAALAVSERWRMLQAETA